MADVVGVAVEAQAQGWVRGWMDVPVEEVERLLVEVDWMRRETVLDQLPCRVANHLHRRARHHHHAPLQPQVGRSFEQRFLLQ